MTSEMLDDTKMIDVDSTLKKLIANLQPGDPVPVPPEPPSEQQIMEGWSGSLEKPLVSIVCLTYNHQAFVQAALNGFLMQKTNFPFEIIVHDDASTDGTIEILLDYKIKYPRLLKLYIQEENQYKKGVGPLGFAFPLAKGKYIAFCEGDDYWIDVNKILKQVSCLEANPDVAVVYTNSVSFSENNCLGKNFGGSRIDLTSEELEKAPGIFTLTTCFRNILDNPIELNFAVYGDQFIWSRLGKFGSGKYMSDILPSFYRVHSGGIHSLASEDAKLFNGFKSFVAMSFYYKRTGNSSLEKYFLDKALVLAFSISGVSFKLVPSMKAITSLVKKIKNLRHRNVG